MKSLKIPETIREAQLVPTTAHYSKCIRASNTGNSKKNLEKFPILEMFPN